jgi:DNA-binding NarL/FixJ family response regulator
MENMQDATSILRVYVVEDSMPICERIVQMINEARDMQVVGTADNASGAITGICACMPHAVILDLRLANSSGLTVLRTITQKAPRPKIMVLTNFSSDQYRDIARAHGADAFLDKSNDFMRITEILHTWRPSPTPAAARLN